MLEFFRQLRKCRDPVEKYQWVVGVYLITRSNLVYCRLTFNSYGHGLVMRLTLENIGIKVPLTCIYNAQKPQKRCLVRQEYIRRRPPRA